MAGGIRLLGEPDLADVVRILEARPLDNVFVASRIRRGGLDPFTLGSEVWGYDEGRRLLSLLHVGANLVPVAATPEALDAFAAGLPLRRAASITGVSWAALGLWERLRTRWPGNWEGHREVRPRQPVMAISGSCPVPADPRVQQIGPEDADSYFDAAVRMYTEEVGTNPLDGGNGYRRYVDSIIAEGSAYGIVERGEVIFKSDVGSSVRDVCQVAGVWLRPDLRGRGISVGAMAGVLQLCLTRWPTVSLYVNDYNAAARALYRRVGMADVGEFATVLY